MRLGGVTGGGIVSLEGESDYKRKDVEESWAKLLKIAWSRTKDDMIHRLFSTSRRL